MQVPRPRALQAAHRFPPPASARGAASPGPPLGPYDTLRALAILALVTVRIRPLFWLFVVAFNLVGTIDLILDYYHATQVGLPAVAGQLGATYAIPILYVPVLMITHVVAFYLLLRPQPKTARAFVGVAKRPRLSSDSSLDFRL